MVLLHKLFLKLGKGKIGKEKPQGNGTWVQKQLTIIDNYSQQEEYNFLRLWMEMEENLTRTEQRRWAHWTTTAPPCGHGLCAACEYALSKRRKPGRPKCPRCRAPEQSESALILEDEVPLLRARHAAVVRTDAAEARRLLSRAAERCRAAQAWEAAAARRDAGLEGRRSSRRHAVLADLELGEALLGLGDFDGRPPRRRARATRGAGTSTFAGRWDNKSVFS